MPVYYLEPSALLKRYREEAGSLVVAELFDLKRDEEVFTTSYFTVVEASSVFARLLRGDLISQRAYRRLVGTFTVDCREIILLESITDEVVSSAIGQASQYALRAPDAVQLASALAQRTVAPQEDFRFVCSDDRLNAAAADRGFEVLDPKAADALIALRGYRRSL